MLSIIIPTFNEERAIEKTLQGIKKLTSTPFELIVADSGSTDRTVHIAERYANRVVRYEDQPKNASRGRNLGASVAQGEYLAFIDADVTVADINTFFPAAIRAFEEDTTLVAIGVRVRTLPEVENWGDWISHRLINFNCFVMNNVLRLAAISGEFQMMRTDAFKAAGGYNEALNITEDNELYGRLRKKGRIRLVRELWVLHPSRRAHAIGWPRLWFELSINWVWVTLFKRPWHSAWKHVR